MVDDPEPPQRGSLLDVAARLDNMEISMANWTKAFSSAVNSQELIGAVNSQAAATAARASAPVAGAAASGCKIYKR